MKAKTIEPMFFDLPAYMEMPQYIEFAATKENMIQRLFQLIKFIFTGRCRFTL